MELFSRYLPFNLGDEAKFGLLIVTNVGVVDEYNVNVELNLRHGSCVGQVYEAQVKIKQDFRFTWIPLKLTIGSTAMANINDELPEHKGVIKVVVSRKVCKHKISDGSIGVKEPFKSIIGKMTNKEKSSGNHLIIHQNVNISHTLILKTKVVHDVHLLVMENVSSHTCIISKVKSDFETLLSRSLQLLPTERFSLVLDAEKIKSNILWVNWSLETPNTQSYRQNIWYPTEIVSKKSNNKLRIVCSHVNFTNGLATLDITIYNNTTDEMDIQLYMGHSDSLVVLQESYSVGLIKGRTGGSCKVEYIVVRRGIQQLPNIKLVDKLSNKSYLLSGVIFQF